MGAKTGGVPPPASPVVAPSQNKAPAGADDQHIPDWVRRLLPDLQLASARNGLDLVAAPSVVITQEYVVIDGQRVGSLKVSESTGGRLQRIDPVLHALKRIRERYKALHPASPFPGGVLIWVDRRVPTLVVKDVFQTAAFAGFPHAAYVVRDRNAPGRYARLNADALVPLPGSKASGRLPPEVIQRIVRAHYDEFRYCYEKGLAKDAKLTGKVVVRFVIGRDGHVDRVTDNGSTLADKDAVKCIFAAYRKLVFPKPEGGIVTVIYPIMFSPSE